MRYLITGAAGFIGAHLAKRISANGDEVLGIDNYSNYYDISLKVERVKSLLINNRIELIEGDIRDSTLICKTIKNFKPDSVIHLAGQPGVRLPISALKDYVDGNLVGFSNVLSQVVQNEVPLFLYASSSSVYGNQAVSPFSEMEMNLKPVSFYGATKLSNELLVPTLVKGSATKARGLRFFTVYGPWGRPDMAYFRLIANAISNVPFFKFGDGNAMRDFTYVEDTISIIYELSKQLKKYDTGFTDVVNIGGGQPHTLNQMIIEISRLTGRKLVINEEDFDSKDVKFTCADPNYLTELINLKPEIKLEFGLKTTINWAQTISVRDQLEKWIKSVV